ncbi:16S rRNA (cytosine(1402)-N(4))-methyltransferase RsmH [Candidatus Dependentiae bacterium]|nr:16S rRNA (cytosine(1402)-N(4))-methyltransferase RsmH [Candidatus Dependentiae bacterium]
MTKIYHKTVLINEVLQYLNPQPNKVYIDATFGGGGHTRAILDAEPNCKVIAIDWDKNAIEINAPALEAEYGDRFTILFGGFGNLTQVLKKAKIGKVDGILADFGTSQYQIAELPGFSFNVDTPLDMRMSPGFYKTTAAHIINHGQEEEIAQILFEYGEEYSSRKIARTIVAYRKEQGPIRTTKQLAEVITSIIPRFSRPVHPATKTFQALRIFVNDELSHIKSLLSHSAELLHDHGRIVCISFHSLEDRIVKQFFRDHKDTYTILTPKVVTATQEELDLNASARSAKLRAAEKK